jgi:hypothetical protein
VFYSIFTAIGLNRYRFIGLMKRLGLVVKQRIPYKVMQPTIEHMTQDVAAYYPVGLEQN